MRAHARDKLKKVGRAWWYNGVGRPKKIKNRKQMQTAIDEYFEGLKGKVAMDDEGEIITDAKGNVIIFPDKPPTTAGLCRALGFNSRQTLLNYRKDGEYADIVDDAMLRIEEYTEARLFDRDGANGAKFSLANNFKWRDKPTVDNSDIMDKLDRVIGDIDAIADK